MRVRDRKKAVAGFKSIPDNLSKFGWRKPYDLHLAQTSDYLSVSWAAGNSHLLPGSGALRRRRRRQLDHAGFPGLIFWTYIVLLSIHVVLSSIAVLSFPKSGVLRIHLGSMALSLFLLVAGFAVYGKLLRAGAISSRSTNFDREVAEL